MTNTKLPNLYKKYWILDEKEWHTYEIGKYHISSIGCSHKDIKDPKGHSGPCLRQTFYDYVDKVERSDEMEGNFDMGRMIHEALQDIYKKNHPNSIMEFPMQLVRKEIENVGSSDIVVFTGMIDGVQHVDILDVKSSSSWTFPKDENDKNITHFDQVYIYSYWLQNLIFNKSRVKIDNLYIVYVDKHNKYTGEMHENYNPNIAVSKFTDYINRTDYLHSKLKNMELPDREPMKWCKYCVYADRCRENVISYEDLKEYSLKEVENIYKEETGKSAIWRENYTKAFVSFKKGYRIEDN